MVLRTKMMNRTYMNIQKSGFKSLTLEKCRWIVFANPLDRFSPHLTKRKTKRLFRLFFLHKIEHLLSLGNGVRSWICCLCLCFSCLCNPFLLSLPLSYDYDDLLCHTQPFGVRAQNGERFLHRKHWFNWSHLNPVACSLAEGNSHMWKAQRWSSSKRARERERDERENSTNSFLRIGKVESDWILSPPIKHTRFRFWLPFTQEEKELKIRRGRHPRVRITPSCAGSTDFGQEKTVAAVLDYHLLSLLFPVSNGRMGVNSTGNWPSM